MVQSVFIASYVMRFGPVTPYWGSASKYLKHVTIFFTTVELSYFLVMCKMTKCLTGFEGYRAKLAIARRSNQSFL